MTSLMAVPGQCRNCGVTDLLVPADPTEHSWLDCARCQTPVKTWGAYKDEALATAAATIRRGQPARARR